MFKLLKFFLLIPVCLAFQSCIEIVQEIKIYPDKSGTVSFSLDVGALGSNFAKIAGEYIDMSMMEDIKKQPHISAKQIENTKGITNIKPISKNEEGLYALSFDFKNDKALNEAFYKLFNSNKNVFLPKVIRIKKHKISVANLAPVVRYVSEKYDKNIKNNQLLSIVSIKQVYVFPGEVKKVSNPRYVKEDYRVNMTCTIAELLNSNLNIGTKIKH